MNLLKFLAQKVFRGVVAASEATRWTTLLYGTEVYAGPVFGRRFIDRSDRLIMLALADDGMFRFAWLPVAEVPAPRTEAEARAYFVTARRRPSVRGHGFVPSMVAPAYCQVCAEGSLEHDRAWAEEAVTRALGERFETRVSFVDATANVTRVEVRPTPTLTPVLSAVPPAPSAGDALVSAMPPPVVSPSRAWRVLTWAEEGQLRDQIDRRVCVISLHGDEGDQKQEVQP